MELNKRFIVICSILLLITISVYAVVSRHYVDSNYNLHNIYNVSNVTITDTFTDGTLTIKDGNIHGASDINSTEFNQNGNPVVDTSTITNLSSNYSEYANRADYWDNLNVPADLNNRLTLDWANITNRFMTAVSSAWFYMSGATLMFNETKHNETTDLRITFHNDSIKSYVDDELAFYEKIVDAFKQTNFTSMYYAITSRFGNDNFTAQYAAMGAYTDDNLTAAEIYAKTPHTNRTDADVNTLIDSRVTQAFIEVLNFNITSELKTYFDSLYQAAGTYVTAVTATSPIASSGGTTPIISWAPVNIALGWENLTNYPAACPADTFVSAVNDSTTCTGISDVYLSNTGDTGTENYNFTKNITQPTNAYKCYDVDCNSSVHYNGSALVIKVN